MTITTPKVRTFSDFSGSLQWGLPKWELKSWGSLGRWSFFFLAVMPPVGGAGKQPGCHSLGPLGLSHCAQIQKSALICGGEKGYRCPPGSPVGAPRANTVTL